VTWTSCGSSQNDCTGDWHLNVDGNKLTVTDEGNVGIGTTSPSYRLHVLSSADFSVHGESSNVTGTGARGLASHATGITYGV